MLCDAMYVASVWTIYPADPLSLMLPNANDAITIANAKKDTWFDAIINTYADC